MGACTSRKEVVEITGRTMGTTYSVKIADPVENTKSLQGEIDKVLEEVNRQMSTYRKDSEISRVNQSPGDQHIKISPWFYKVLDFSIDLARKTEGAYDPTVGPLVNLWGFGPDGERKVPSEGDIKEAKALVGYEKITLYPGETALSKAKDLLYIDLSSSAKGFGVDAVSEKLLDLGFQNHLIEIGGELRARGEKKGQAWKVAIEKPQENGRALQKILVLEDKSIATSGDYRNFFKEGGKRYSHTMDKNTGKPVKTDLLSVSVLASDCMTADAWATALMALGFEKARDKIDQYKLETILVYESQGKAQVFESLIDSQ